jgi:hypothetical protein
MLGRSRRNRRVTQPLTIVRVYKGKQQADANPAFAADAAQLANQGYFPSTQSWAQGQWGCGAWLIAALFILLLGFGLLIIAYMLIVKPAGTLTVTYEYRPPQQTIVYPTSQA